MTNPLLKILITVFILVGAFMLWYTVFALWAGVPKHLFFDYQIAWTLISNAGTDHLQGKAFSSFLVLIAPFGLYLALNTPNDSKNRFGDARWATLNEIRKYGYFGTLGIIIGQTKAGKLLFSHGPKTIGLSARPRSGKGVSLVIPNLLNWPGSAVVVDIKKEIFNITSGFRSEFQEIYCFDPLNPDKESHRINIFENINKDESARISEVQKISMALLPDGKDKFWDAGARSIFVGIALYLLETGTHCSVPAILEWAGGSTNLQDKMHDIINDPKLKLSSRCVTLFREYSELESDSKLVSGFLQNFNIHLEPFSSPLVAAATDYNDIDLTDLKTNPKTIYLVSRPEDIGMLGRLFGLITDNIVFSLTKGEPEQGETGKVLMMLDEFTALGRLDRLKQGAAFLGGYGVRICIIYQNHAQLETTYDISGAKELVGLMHERIMFASSDIDEAERVCRELGQKTIKVKSHSFSKMSKSRSFSEAGMALLTADQIKRLDDSKQIILAAGQRPILCNKVIYYKDKRFTSRIVDKTAEVEPLKLEKYLHFEEFKVVDPEELEKMDFADDKRLSVEELLGEDLTS